jgi:hypothetical protein
MKPTAALIVRCSALLTLLLSLTSCLMVDPYGPTTSYYDDGYGYGGGGYYSRPSYYGGGYGSGYGYSSYSSYGNSYCSVCHHCPCTCSHSHTTTHRSSSSSDEGRIHLLKGSDGDHSNRPDGAHSRDWFEKRGYDVDQYKWQKSDGSTHGRDQNNRGHNDPKRESRSNNNSRPEIHIRETSRPHEDRSSRGSSSRDDDSKHSKGRR